MLKTRKNQKPASWPAPNMLPPNSGHPEKASQKTQKIRKQKLQKLKNQPFSNPTNRMKRQSHNQQTLAKLN
jgi:hypothetical protein